MNVWEEQKVTRDPVVRCMMSSLHTREAEAFGSLVGRVLRLTSCHYVGPSKALSLHPRPQFSPRQPPLYTPFASARTAAAMAE